MSKQSAVAFSLLACALLAAPPVPAADDSDPVRQELLHRIDAERKVHGVAPIVRIAALDRAAQDHADEMAARGSIHSSGGSQSMRQRLDKFGYAWSECTENVTATNGDLDAVFKAWRVRNPESYGRLLQPSFSNLGIGLARVDGTAVYDFLVAVPEVEAFGRTTETLRDITLVRTQVLAKVNAERGAMHAPPLAASGRLDRAAQTHAETMLARSFFEHRAPDGHTVRERTEEQGYTWRDIGENLAEGQTTVDEVMASWMKSAEHRHNILDRAFTDLGVGLAYGKDPKTGSYRILWVQVFGTPGHARSERGLIPKTTQRR